MASELGEDDYYKILESKSVWIQNRVNPVLKALTFQAGFSVQKLADAVEHFKEKDGAVDKRQFNPAFQSCWHGNLRIQNRSLPRLAPSRTVLFPYVGPRQG
jgi:hypothetical protein